MTGNSPSETDLDQLIDCLLWRPGAVIAAQMREAGEALLMLLDVAKAAKELADSASVDHPKYLLEPDCTIIRESALVALESALDAAGYGMTDEELEAALDEADLPGGIR